MLSHFRRDDILLTAAAVLLAVAIPLGVTSCDKVPLLAPTGTVITLLAGSEIVALNSTVDIVATAIENGQASSGTGSGTTAATGRTGAGTPVQNGTVINFTTTIGRIEPSEARTHNGQVTVQLVTSSQSGTATITAYSGGASNTVQVKVGSAAVDHVLVSASPQTLAPSGGNSTISARVEDASGTGVPGIPVTFTSDAGSLNPSSATTDSNGVATTILSTSQKATVTANVAGKTANVVVNLNPRTGITLAAPTTQVSAGQPAAFTIGVASTANVRDVVVDWGDGSQQHLGAISASTTVAHTYLVEGTYTVQATATDASGFSESVGTSLIVLPAQPPTVTITAPQSAPVNTVVTVSANVTGATSTIIRYEWEFGGTGAVPASLTTSSRQTTVTWTAIGTKTIRVRVIQATGPEGDNVATINIVAAGGD